MVHNTPISLDDAKDREVIYNNVLQTPKKPQIEREKLTCKCCTTVRGTFNIRRHEENACKLRKKLNTPTSKRSSVYSMENIEHESNIAQVHENIEEVQENIEIASATPSPTRNNTIPTFVVTETISEQTTISNQLPQSSYLVDSSMGESTMQAESTMRKFSETTHAQNLLEDSSISTPQVAVSNEKDVVNIYDLDVDDVELKTELSLNKTTPSVQSDSCQTIILQLKIQNPEKKSQQTRKVLKTFAIS